MLNIYLGLNLRNVFSEETKFLIRQSFWFLFVVRFYSKL